MYGAAKRSGCSERRLFVCGCVCQHDNFRTIKHRMMKLGDWVHCTKISPEFEFGGHRPHTGPHAFC